MSKNDGAILNRLDELYDDGQNLKKLPLGINDKYAVFSDLHLGDGLKADNFTRNEETIKSALYYYKDKGYSIILLGDIEEFWQFDYFDIMQRYDNSVYRLLRGFGENKVHRVFGNHDKEWSGFKDPVQSSGYISHGAPEAILVGNYMFMVHGHQGDELSDKKAWSSRYWVRVFKIIEPVARKLGYENYAATKSQIPKDRERVLYRWAKDKKIILVCGHTHRAIFASRSYYKWLKEQIESKQSGIKKDPTNKTRRKELSGEIKKLKNKLRTEKRRKRDINPLQADGEPLPCYFNSGSGLYREGMTNIEIERDKIRLIKWHNDNSLPFKKRRIQLWKEGSLSEFMEKLNIKSV